MLLLGLMVKSGLRRSKGGHCTEEKQWPQKLFFFCLPSAMFKYICQALHTLGDWWRSGSLFLYKHCLCLHKTANFTEKIFSTKVNGLWLRAIVPRETARTGWRLSCPQRRGSLEHLLQALRFVWRPDFQKVSFALGEASGRKMNANPAAKWGLQYKNKTHLRSGLRLGTEKTIEGMLGPWACSTHGEVTETHTRTILRSFPKTL